MMYRLRSPRSVWLDGRVQSGEDDAKAEQTLIYYPGR